MANRWVVNANDAKQLIEDGATVLDARGRRLGLRRLQGAIAVSWKQFSPKAASSRGNLLADDELLTEKLRALGISNNKPVVVFADPLNGWGEEGRIVWMLRTLGHTQAVMVEGGYQSLIDAGVPRKEDRGAGPIPGDFVVARNLTWDIQQDALKDSLGSDNLVVIDTREYREFLSGTPYGEQRGGHIPGAVHLHFKDFLRADGTLLSKQAMREKLQAIGITPNTQVVTYCTGGIRSGQLTSVLVTLGFQSQNYAGSMWEWSASDAEAYPLESN